MCGICGLFEYDNKRTVSREQLQRMTETLHHRGPDDEGYLIRPNIGLGMRRLSIIDLAGGKQPISNEEQSIWIIFNGEIYNFKKLQKDLLQRGHRLRTCSDTEVILHLYEDYGLDCVHHLDGMFAFAVYDERPLKNVQQKAPGDGSSFAVFQSLPGGGRLFLARDRLGKKPLYYADLDGTLIFGSELKPILQDPRVSMEIDFEALHHYLSCLVVPAPFSIFKAIRKLPPGHVLECDLNGIRVRRYWNYLDFVDDQRFQEQEVVTNVRRLLFAAVEKRLVADVPLGAFLSGGLDSSTVVAIMSRLKSEPVKTFSIGFEGPDTHNELPYAKALAQYYRTDHHEFLVKPDIVELLPELVQYADEPFAISSAIPLYLIAREARQHVTVVLTGDGGDEVFGGYKRYLYEHWVSGYRGLPHFMDRLLVGGANVLGGRVDEWSGRLRSQVARFVINARKNTAERRLGWSGAFTEAEKVDLYSPAVYKAFAGHPTAVFLQSQIGDNRHLSPVLQQNCMDMLVWLPDEMLAKVDRMTMATSLEARCPLLDIPMVEYTAGLSFRMKNPGWRTANLKHLLRQAVADLLPPDLLKRPKHGFNVPLDTWFRKGAKSYLEGVLSPERIRRRGIFDHRAVTSLLRRHLAGQINASNRLYALLVFEVWAEATL